MNTFLKILTGRYFLVLDKLIVVIIHVQRPYCQGSK